MSRSGYVVAGFETLATIMDNFVKNTKGRFDNNFTRSDISDFLSKTCSGFLHSYGQNFHGKKKYTNHSKSEADLFLNCRKTGFFDNSDFIVDSGGFQISIGKLTIEESNLLLKMYYEFLEDYHHVLQKAFILDIPPGPSCDIFSDFNQLLKLNLVSYLRAKNLAQEVRDKIIYVHHFRTPRLWDLYLKILREYEMFDSFKYHGTGGIVANMAGDLSVPRIIYVLPIIPLLNDCKKYKRDTLNFHVLGGSNFRDIFFYELFKIHVQKIHNINLNITYDSSGLFKGLMIARFLVLFDGDNFVKTSIKNFDLDKRFKDGTKIIDAFRQNIAYLSTRYNIKPINIENVYQDDGEGTFFEEVKVYSFLCMLDQYQQIQEKMRTESARIYPLYESGNILEFTDEVMNVTKMLNSGKITKKQRVKAESVSRSLDMLTNLDEDHCKHMVERHLAKDEFIDLIPEQKVLTL